MLLPYLTLLIMAVRARYIDFAIAKTAIGDNFAIGTFLAYRLTFAVANRAVPGSLADYAKNIGCAGFAIDDASALALLASSGAVRLDNIALTATDGARAKIAVATADRA